MIVERLMKVALLGSSWVLYFLLALSVVSLAAMFERWMFFRRHHDDLPIARANDGADGEVIFWSAQCWSLLARFRAAP